MILSAVKTESRAKEMLKRQLNAFSFENGSCECECGETSSIKAYDKQGELIGIVAICDGCGDDSSFSDIVQLY